MKKIPVHFQVIGKEYCSASFYTHVYRIPNIGETVFLDWPGQTMNVSFCGYRVIDVETDIFLMEEPLDCTETYQIETESYSIVIEEREIKGK